jgi:phosphatidylserine decarboxylase
MPVKGPSPPLSQSHRIGGWLPRDPRKIRDIANRALARAEKDNLKWTDVVTALQTLINTNPTVFMLFTEMLTEVCCFG